MTCFRVEYGLEIWERKLFRQRWMDGNFQEMPLCFLRLAELILFFFLIQI